MSSEPISREFLSATVLAGISASGLPPLYPGDHLDQPTFHARYEAMPAGFRAELIEGVVIVPSPTSCEHAGPDGLAITWLGVYRGATPGTEMYPNVTVILGPHSEPQPDVGLLISPQCGGQSRREGKYVAGAPELVVETAYSSEACDLYSKRRDYERAGVKEYVVVMLRERGVVWFVLQDQRFVAVEPDGNGIFRSAVFPGLWLDSTGLLAGSFNQVLDTLRRGIESAEHTAFVERLQREQARLSASPSA